MDQWGKLWDLATSEPGDPAIIEVDTEEAGSVFLTWPDGSRASFYWRAGDWQREEALDGVPGDVAARDAL